MQSKSDYLFLRAWVFCMRKIKRLFFSVSLRRQYPPLSLFELQRMIDTGRIDATKPIDLVALCNSKLYSLEPQFRHSGVNLTEDGVEIFQARVNLEVQWTTESVIAAVERNGGTITTAYYDPESILAMHHMVNFFKKGEAIPRRDIPPENCLEFYSSAQFRGYLADPADVSKLRVELAQKFGYELPSFDEYEPELREMLLKRKDPRQIFYDLQPGWVVDVKDRKVLKPKHEELVEFYRA